jgi:hypothetical protein
VETIEDEKKELKKAAAALIKASVILMNVRDDGSFWRKQIESVDDALTQVGTRLMNLTNERYPGTHK